MIDSESDGLLKDICYRHITIHWHKKGVNLGNTAVGTRRGSSSFTTTGTVSVRLSCEADLPSGFESLGLPI